MLLLAPFAEAAIVTQTVFWDDMEDETHGEDNPSALIGAWGWAVGAEDGYAIEYAQEGIPAPPNGGNLGLKIERVGGQSTWATFPPLTEVGGHVHAEWDWYITANGLDYAVFGLTANTNHVSTGRPDAGWAPNIGYRGPDGNAPNLQNLINDRPNWIDLGTTPAIPKPAQGQWHKLEIDYTLGDDTSMTLTVNGVSANCPGPWGWDALGNTADPRSTGPVEMICGVIWYNNGGSATFGTEQYVDNLLVTFAAEGLVIASVDVSIQDTLSFPSEAGLLYSLEYALPPVTTIWQATGFSVIGDGGTMFAFDPAEPGGSSTTKIYRAVHSFPSP